MESASQGVTVTLVTFKEISKGVKELQNRAKRTGRAAVRHRGLTVGLVAEREYPCWLDTAAGDAVQETVE